MKYFNELTKRFYEIKNGRVIAYQENEEILSMEENIFSINLIRKWVDDACMTWTDVYNIA